MDIRSRIAAYTACVLLSGNWAGQAHGAAALGGGGGPGPGPQVPSGQPVIPVIPVYQPPIQTPVTPPVVVRTPPPVVATPPRIFTPPPTVNSVLPPNILPTDVTGRITGVEGQLPQNASALSGIKLSTFPSKEAGRDEEPGITARGDENAVFHKQSPFFVKYEKGDVMVSIRKPCRLGFVSTPLGEIALTGDADIMMSDSEDGVLHIFNLSGNGETVRIKFNDAVLPDEKEKTFALAPGYELIGAPHQLSYHEIRRQDSIARRNFKVIQNGQVAVCEFSVESVLVSSNVIAKLQSSEAGPKDRRVIADLSKMAAVLNEINGPYGYTVETVSGSMAQK